MVKDEKRKEDGTHLYLHSGYTAEEFICTQKSENHSQSGKYEGKIPGSRSICLLHDLWGSGAGDFVSNRKPKGDFSLSQQLGLDSSLHTPPHTHIFTQSREFIFSLTSELQTMGNVIWCEIPRRKCGEFFN